MGCVLQLLKAGRNVVAACRDGNRAVSIFKEAGLKPGLQSNGVGLTLDSGIDITNPSTLGEPLWKGVSQVPHPWVPTGVSFLHDHYIQNNLYILKM